MYDKNAMTMKMQSHHEGKKETKVGKLIAENFVIFVSSFEITCKRRGLHNEEVTWVPIGVGNGSRRPRPPNRACGFPAHGSPVGGFLIGIGSLTYDRNGEQPCAAKRH